MKKFDTQVQYIKYKVLREVARKAWDGRLLESVSTLSKRIIPGNEATMRCCVFKERAIISERIKLAIGGDTDNPGIVEVIDFACDECPAGGYEISGACRGCLAHHCAGVCPRGAIAFDHEQKAHIDKQKCVECGKCAVVCPFNAVVNYKRPCESACKVSAIQMGEDHAAHIDNDKCIACGACVYQCPFGAIQDKSYIIDAIDIIRNSENNTAYPVYAVVAPSISSQFSHAKLGQVIAAIKQLGACQVVEAAFGADIVACREADELAEKGFLTSSCCPAFVDYIRKEFPSLAEKISHNPSPMAVTAQCIKQTVPDARVIFIGPCTAKKAEAKTEAVHPYVDCVLTFEELQALIDSRDIDMQLLPEDTLDDASYYGRIFARSGGLSDAVRRALHENGHTDFDLNPAICDGIEQCRIALIKASKNVLAENFIEGMACSGGCIGGAGCLSHGPKNKSDVDKYGKLASEKNIRDAAEKWDQPRR